MGRRQKGIDINGILLLDKRAGVSSNAALQEVKRLFNAQKAGHTGSLDPLATGLLPICFGAATKISSFMLDSSKRYLTEVKLGVTTTTGDLEGEIVDSKPVPRLDEPTIEACLKEFRGQIQQVPPMYSALKHNGQRLYKLARKGQTVERVPRSVNIMALQLLNFGEDYLSLEVYCSKGTYVRTLVEDIGQALGSGATVAALRRTQVGDFLISEATSYQKLVGQFDENSKNDLIKPIESAFQTWPLVDLEASFPAVLQSGLGFAVSGSIPDGWVKLYRQEHFLGIGKVFCGNVVPKRLFNSEHYK